VFRFVSFSGQDDFATKALVGMTQNIISIRNVDHYYEWVKQPSAQPKPVMVFMHGWGGSCRYWRSTAQVMAAQFDCLLYDMRGFGQSRLPENSPEFQLANYELETYAEDLAVLLDQLQLQQVYLNAHSTGTSIAVFFLNLYPERVKQAILTCGGIFEYNEFAFKQFHRFGTYVVKFRPRWLDKIPGIERLFMARFLTQSIPITMQDFLLADYDAALGTMLTAVSARAAEIMPEEFARVTVPTLLISGEFDQIIPASLGDNAASLNPLIQRAVIAKTGHFPMLEATDDYFAVVNPFLQLSVPSQPDMVQSY
jgi:pimeloyl-ACP methyl ester carboxylesterase